MGKGITIEYVPADSLVPASYNPREMTDEALKRLATLIDSHGWVDPIIARREDRLIIGGHQRIRANRIRKVPDVDVPVVFLDGIDDARAMALNVALNNRETQGAYDFPKLADVLAEIDTGELDIPALTGFSEDDLAGLMHGLDEANHEPDEVPEPPEDPVSRTGDLWVMGEHRLICGDATNHVVVGVVMAGDRAHLCLTDPPYGVGFDYESHDDTKQNLAALIAGFFPLAEKVSERILLTSGNENQRLYPQPDWTLCWFVAAGTGRNRWGFTCWQPILAYGKDPFLATGRGSRPDAFEMCEAAPKDTGHSCPKPVGVWCKILERGSAERGERVYDPFSGSGTTIIACEQLGRKCYAVEIEPRYIDVAVKRWQNLTGKSATLEGDGRTFAEIEKHRITTDGRPEGQSEAALEAG